MYPCAQVHWESGCEAIAIVCVGIINIINNAIYNRYFSHIGYLLNIRSIEKMLLAMVDSLSTEKSSVDLYLRYEQSKGKSESENWHSYSWKETGY